MNTNTNEETLGNAYEAHKKNVGNLPTPLAISIHPVANKGKISDGVLTNSAFQIFVKCLNNGREEWRPESEWYIIAGMKTSRKIYSDIEKARAAKADIRNTWGVKKAPKARRTTKSDEIAALTALVAQLKAELAAKAA